jgi:lambda repressor-like predicted transcriptional regulator
MKMDIRNNTKNNIRNNAGLQKPPVVGNLPADVVAKLEAEKAKLAKETRNTINSVAADTVAQLKAAADKPATATPAVVAPIVAATPVVVAPSPYGDTAIKALIAKYGEQSDAGKLLSAVMATIPESNVILRKTAVEGMIGAVRNADNATFDFKFQAFKTEFESQVGKLAWDCLTKNGLTKSALESKKVVITFPDTDKVTIMTESHDNGKSNGKNSKSGKSSGGNGFKSMTDKVEFKDEVTSDMSHNTISTLCTAIGVKYNGRSNGFVAITDPMDGDRKQLPWVGVVTDRASGLAVQYVEAVNGTGAHLATPDGKVSRDIIITKQSRQSR